MKGARQHTPSGMKSTQMFSLFVTGLIFVGRGAEPPSGAVIHIDHETVAAAFARGGPLLTTNQFKIQAGRRETGGEVEMHERDTDIFHVLEGSATFVTGGKLVEPRTISFGEVRAKEIAGGETRKLVKGDVIVIPTHVPHWFKEVRGPFLYYVVKVSQ
jgi:glc operon protein GlcG